ncbi:hypothetical protein [Pseudomonas sp. Irchel s3b5]|uniref:hypothetical protein n=1 Tax=Pseudomonas sp. Irchel s3b5 TaxID=2009077 RepID=UPI000BA33D66|nr:hypothetical protein [Pseudomonas sp. Irchel s3b5]
MYKYDVINSVKYYREAIAKSLVMAHGYTGQASVQDLSDLRFFYSTCLASIVSLTEYLGDVSHPYSVEFKAAIDSGFVFEGAPDGEQNYNYLRGVRNMVVHRGYDISAMGHVVDNRLWFVLPDQANSISGKTFYTSYERHLPLLISKTLIKLDVIIQNHVDNYLSQLNDRTEEEVEAEIRLSLANDNFLVPPEIKVMMLEYMDTHGIPSIPPGNQ